MAHSLHNTAHMVIGDFGLSKIGKLLGKKPIIFGNDKDHLFDSDNPHFPVVLNTDEIQGVSESTLCLDLYQKTDSLPYPTTAPHISLRQQVA
jgi:hypothetical protein